MTVEQIFLSIKDLNCEKKVWQTFQGFWVLWSYLNQKGHTFLGYLVYCNKKWNEIRHVGPVWPYRFESENEYITYFISLNRNLKSDFGSKCVEIDVKRLNFCMRQLQFKNVKLNLKFIISYLKLNYKTNFSLISLKLLLSCYFFGTADIFLKIF